MAPLSWPSWDSPNETTEWCLFLLNAESKESEVSSVCRLRWLWYIYQAPRLNSQAKYGVGMIAFCVIRWGWRVNSLILKLCGNCILPVGWRELNLLSLFGIISSGRQWRPLRLSLKSVDGAVGAVPWSLELDLTTVWLHFSLFPFHALKWRTQCAESRDKRKLQWAMHHGN